MSDMSDEMCGNGSPEVPSGKQLTRMLQKI